MTPKGNYNFGIYNPPSSLEALRYSQELSADLALRLNNLQTGKETGYKQKVETYLPKFSPPDENLVTYINNLSLETIINMIRQGWKKESTNLIRSFPTPTPAPTPTPLGQNFEINWEEPILPKGNPNTYCIVIVAIQFLTYDVRNGAEENRREYYCSGSYIPRTNTSSEKLSVQQNYKDQFGSGTHNYPDSAGIWGSNRFLQIDLFNRIINTSNPTNGIYQPDNIIWGFDGAEQNIYNFLRTLYINRTSTDRFQTTTYTKQTYTVIYSTCSLPPDNAPPPPPPPPPPRHLGSSPPPPSSRRNRMCCDCNTIASIMEAQFMGQIKLMELIKDHIDQRIKEQVVIHGKQLEALEIDLQPIVDRLNQVESNIWNGIER